MKINEGFQVGCVLIEKRDQNLYFDGRENMEDPKKVMLAMLKVAKYLKWWNYPEIKNSVSLNSNNQEILIANGTSNVTAEQAAELKAEGRETELFWGPWKGILPIKDCVWKNSKIPLISNITVNNDKSTVYISNQKKVVICNETGKTSAVVLDKSLFQKLVNTIIFDPNAAEKIYLSEFLLNMLEMVNIEELGKSFVLDEKDFSIADQKFCGFLEIHCKTDGEHKFDLKEFMKATSIPCEELLLHYFKERHEFTRVNGMEIESVSITKDKVIVCF